MPPIENMGSLVETFAKTGGPAVVTLVVVGYLIWKAVNPLMLKLLGSLDTLSENLKDMTKEIGHTTTELKLMAQRLDVLERQVSRVSPRHESEERTPGTPRG